MNILDDILSGLSKKKTFWFGVSVGVVIMGILHLIRLSLC